jgi:glycosyltransferase involved in cell wall biosynthesis
MTHISVVIPVYGCSTCLAQLHKRLKSALKSITSQYEIIFVDDDSRDLAWEEIRSIAGRDTSVIGIKLSRNFGQHIAITAGIDRAKGDWIVVMDCDLQDRPEEIPRLYGEAKTKQLDMVFARRIGRHDGIWRKWTSYVYNLIFSVLSGEPSDPAIGHFGIISRRIAVEFRKYREIHRSYRQIIMNMGFKHGVIDVTHDQRYQGTSSYTIGKLIMHAVNSAAGYSTRILTIWISLGFGIALLAGIVGFVVIVGSILRRFTVPGWASVMVLVSFLSGIMLTGLGVVALYLAKLFEEVKNRPLYTVEEAI